MSFKYDWKIKDGYPEKNGLNVYSCFACGGGSTMGYKLAGYTVIGANDIDPKMAMIYKENHKPKYHHLMDIRELKERQDLPEEMYHLDILDGSPPCSTFSMAGQREKAWGKEKVFREGQAAQRLDDLFFRFIELADKLKPKVVISENVKGMLAGSAKAYVKAIKERFDEIGYDTQVFLLNGATMGVPQRRERVFFISRRKDLKMPELKLSFNERPILFGKVRSEKGDEPSTHESKLLNLMQPGDKKLSDINIRVFKKNSGFGHAIVSDMDICPTIVSAGEMFRAYDRKRMTDMDFIRCGTFPSDYNFMGQDAKYVIGMSVPPLMVAGLSKEVAKQLFGIKY